MNRVTELSTEAEAKLKKYCTDKKKAKAIHQLFKTKETPISDFQYYGLQLIYGLAKRCKSDGKDIGKVSMETSDIPGRKYKSDILLEKYKLVFEFDGTMHDTKEDIEKRNVYEQNGYRVISIRSESLPPIKHRDVIITSDNRLTNKAREKILLKLYAILKIPAYSLKDVLNCTAKDLDLFIANYWYENDRDYFNEKMLPLISD